MSVGRFGIHLNVSKTQSAKNLEILFEKEIVTPKLVFSVLVVGATAIIQQAQFSGRILPWLAELLKRVLVQIVRLSSTRVWGRCMAYAASTAFQISGAVLPLTRSLPILNWRLRHPAWRGGENRRSFLLYRPRDRGMPTALLSSHSRRDEITASI
jgi:hypothetical protein